MTKIELASLCGCLLLPPLPAQGAPAATLPGIQPAMRKAVEDREISGAVTVVVSKDQVLHCDPVGLADVAGNIPMTADTLFWIASMSKPVTATAVLMLQDEGKLRLTDPVSKFIPEFRDLKTPSGKLANLTVAQILTHTSGLAEAPGDVLTRVHALADLIPHYLAAPMQFEPGTRWSYCQSGINTAGRIVEIVSGKPFDVFLEERLFRPLGMAHTTFYPSRQPGARLVTAYRKSQPSGELEAVAPRLEYGRADGPPLGNGGLFSTGPDYARFCQMLLAGGTRDGRRYLSAEALKLLSTVQTGDLPTGFFQSESFGNRGTNYGWGIGTCVLRAPHPGVAAMLSPGSYGHGGAWGTQAWLDPVRGVAFILMVQRADFPNSDASRVRQAFQEAAVEALRK